MSISMKNNCCENFEYFCKWFTMFKWHTSAWDVNQLIIQQALRVSCSFELFY